MSNALLRNGKAGSERLQGRCAVDKFGGWLRSLWIKKAPPEGGASVVEAGFIQARNLSSSANNLRRIRGGDKCILACRTESLDSIGISRICALFVLGLAALAPTSLAAEPAHGIAMYGEPELAPGFTHLPSARPDAPRVGRPIFVDPGSLDGLNPYIRKGDAPWPIQTLTVESLMARSHDEPFTLYGLLAESVETPEDRSFVEFTLREEARFSDGTPVTVEDVIWSIRTLGTEGHPRYRNSWSAIAGIEQTGERSVRIDFSEPNRELPLILGLRPILKKAQWEGQDFASSGMVLPIGSGPYKVERFEAGRMIEFARDPDWWGRDLGINQGLHNFDRIRFDYFRNEAALWEAVKAGAISVYAEYDPVRWIESYAQPVERGTLELLEIEHQRPTGMEGFVFNTRKPIFADRNVREALALTFDWEWINNRLFRGGYQRIESYFDNSPLGFHGAAEGREREILLPFAEHLPEGTLEEGWRPPSSDGSGRDRRNLRRAGQLLDEAGWKVSGNGRRRNADDRPLSFEILLVSARDQRLASLWRESLGRIGVEAEVRLVDEAQYQQRRTDYDYDVIVNRWAMSLSPGIEQRLYFGAEGREDPGTRNYMGVADPAVEAAIDAMLSSRSREDFEASVRALDRVLSAGIYVVPFGYLPTDRIAFRPGFGRPEKDSLYGWWGWWSGPAQWWREPG